MAKPAETEAAALAGYSVSDERLVDRRKLAALLGPDGLSFDRLQPYSESAAFWAESVAIAHRHFGFGLNQRVGIIDSGFAGQCAKALNIDIDRSADFTGKGIEDMLGHGTCVGALLNAVAPQAIQIHAKVLHTRAASVAEIAERLEKAVTHLESAKVDIVNVSFNHLTGFHEHDPVDFRPGWYCHCPICAFLSGYVKRTGASVFVSEGNFKHGKRPEGSWSCPAAAHYVTPVFGYGPDGKFYDVNMPDMYGVLAPAQIGLVPHRLTIVDRLRTVFGRPRAEVIVGSSYAAPLAAGTHACVRSLLLELGYHRPCVPPRNHEEGDHAADAQFDFPLDNLFFSPAERLDDTLAFDRQAEWFGAYNYAIVSANMQLA